MDKKDYHFTVDGQEIVISVDIAPPNRLVVPIYKPTTDTILGFSSVVSEEEFIADIKKLLPKKIDTTFFDYIIEIALFETIQAHLNKFGRLTDSDMELYVAETILVLTAVASSMKMDMISDDDKEYLFNHLCEKITTSMP